MPIATQVINDGVGAGYTVIEATAQGDIASDVLISNDGIAQFRGIILWTKNASYRATPKTFDSAGINGVLTTAHGLGLVPIVELEGAQHTITSPILLQDSSTEIHMRSATILHANNGMNDYIFKCNQSSGLLDNMAIIGSGKLDCNAANQTAGGGLDLKGASRFHLEDFWVEAPYESALHVHDSGGTFGYQNWLLNLRIMDGYLSPGVGRGIWLDNNDENIIRGCLIQGMGGTTDNDGWGIIDNNGLNLIDGCTFLGNGQGNNHAGGIKCYAAATGSRIIGCQFDGVKFTNVALFGGRNKVIGCSFLNIGYNNGVANSADGVYSKGLDNIIMGNDFVPEGSGTNGCYAQVELDGPSGEGYNIVVNNVFQAINTGGHNLLIDGTPSGNVTSPNILH